MVRVVSNFGHIPPLKHECSQFNYFYVCFGLKIALRTDMTDYAL